MESNLPPEQSTWNPAHVGIARFGFQIPLLYSVLDSNDVLGLSQLDSNYDINVKTQKEVGIEPHDDDVSRTPTDKDDERWNPT